MGTLDTLFKSHNSSKCYREKYGSGVWKMDIATGKVVLSEEAREIIGLSKEIRIKNLRDFIKVLYPYDTIVLYEIERRIYTNKLPFEEELKIASQGKSIRIIKLYIDILELEGRVDVIGSVQDITQQIHSGETAKDILAITKAEEALCKSKARLAEKLQQEIADRTSELERQNQKLQESYQSLERKDNFIRMTSHELKTPITAIQGYVQLLLQSYENHADTFLASSLNTLDRQIRKLTKLMNELLDVNRMDTNSIEVQVTEFDITEMIRETVSFMQPTTAHQLIVTGSNSLLVKADRERINQVFVNLLTNAVKYSPQADKVLINITDDHQYVIISVTDYGIGIPAEFHNKIFDLFYRVQTAKEQSFSGFGIGLYIAAEIISKHQGKIWVESEEGRGSTFYFSFKKSALDAVPSGDLSTAC